MREIAEIVKNNSYYVEKEIDDQKLIMSMQSINIHRNSNIYTRIHNSKNQACENFSFIFGRSYGLYQTTAIKLRLHRSPGLVI